MGEEITNPHIASVVENAGLRMCTSCKTYRPLGDFGTYGKSGKPRSTCKECARLYSKLWYESKKLNYADKAAAKETNPAVEPQAPVTPNLGSLKNLSNDALLAELKRRQKSREVDIRGIFTPASLMDALAHEGYTGELQYEFREIRTVTVRR